MKAGGLGLALGSGSARGLAHIGVLKVFERESLPIHLIAGTSIGALIGGAYAIGMTAREIEAVALATNIWRLVSLVDIARPTTALVNGRKVERFIRQFAGGKTFADTKVPFACVAVDVANGQEVVLREGDLAGAIRASISTPVIFAPVERDGQLLVDGAVLNSVPVDVARQMGADVVVAVTNHGIPRSEMPVHFNVNDTDGESLDAARIVATGFTEIVSSRAVSLVRDRLRSLSVYQHAAGSLDLMLREIAEPRLRAADLVIAPQVDGVASYSFYDAKRIIAMGEKAAEAAVGGIHRLMAARQIA
jgi:NTE family protein